jgi:hypothetical protein
MQLFLRTSETQLELIEVDAEQTIADFLADQSAADGAALWLEDAETPLEPARSLRDAGLEDRARVHISTCRKVEVVVHFNGDKEKEFPPAATLGSVFEWATGPHGFKLSATERAKHTLTLCDSETESDRAEHVGALAEDCRVCFDLAPKDRFAG